MARFRTAHSHIPWFRWSWPSTKAIVLGVALFPFGLLLAQLIPPAGIFIIVIGLALTSLGAIWWHRMPDSQRVRYYARQALYDPRRGNPLSLRDGERLPALKVTESEPGVFWLEVRAIALTIEELKVVRAALSSGMYRKLAGYAAVAIDIDPAARFVGFKIEDATVDRSITVASLDDLATGDATRLTVQRGRQIDFRTSGSILVVGPTRTGKTTAVIALTMQVLGFGPDQHGSRVVIFDPKQAELSRLPHTVTLDAEGTARPMLDALSDFEHAIKARQMALNDASEARGDAVKWWELGMHPSLLFIDEFVTLRSLFPARAEKDDSDYCVKKFDDLLRRIITMGASAGCFVILSIAQANAEQLPTMLRSAFSTRVLFGPTPDEGRLLWASDKIAALQHRVYGPGDAWFSSTDGVHDTVSYVHFPRFAPGFGEYRVLGELLSAYYRERPRRGFAECA